MNPNENVFLVICVSVAGPVIGSAIGVAFPGSRRPMEAMLSFAAGTMLAISFLELLPEGLAVCGFWASAAGLILGLAAACLLEDRIRPPQGGERERAALLLLAAITLHNLPEGIAMAAGEAFPGGSTVLLIAVAIAAHDIPEGVCTAAPYYYATGRRLRAFLLSSATCLPTVVGYLLGRAALGRIPPFTLGIVTCATAGLMLYISCAELLPAAGEKGAGKLPMVALFLGIVFVLALQAML